MDSRILGVVYAAGFLVVLNFLDRFGIREAGSDLWKTRYIHIGILSLAFPVIFNGTILSLIYLIFHGKFDKTIMRQRLLPIGLLVTNLELVSYFLITFTHRIPGGNSIAGLSPLLCIVVATLLGVPTLLLIDRKVAKNAGGAPRDGPEPHPDMLSFNARRVLASVVVVLVVVVLDIWFFAESLITIPGLQIKMALIYVGFSVLIGVIISIFAIEVATARGTPQGNRRIRNIDYCTVFISGCSCLCVWRFPEHPGDTRRWAYTLSPKVILTFKSDQKILPSESKYFDKSNSQVTIPLILIEETAWAFYLADPLDAGGPAEWKTIGGRKPEILIVNKTEVTKVRLESRNAKKMWQSP